MACTSNFNIISDLIVFKLDNIKMEFQTQTNPHIAESLSKAGLEPTKTYVERDWKPVEHTQAEIDQALQVLRMDKQSKKHRIDNFINDPKTNKFKGQGIVELAKELKKGNAQLKETLKSLEHLNNPANYNSSQLGLSYQQKQGLLKTNTDAMNELFALKTGFPRSAENLRKLKAFLSSKGVDISEVSNNQLRDLVLLDDWATIASHAIPLIIEHGPKAIDWLWNKFVTKLQGWNAPGQDAGLWMGDYNANNVLLPSKVAYQGGANVHGSYFEDRDKLAGSRFQYDAVSPEYLASFICPEKFGYRQPTSLQLKTGIVMGSTEIILQSDANGNTMALINPNNLDLGAGVMSTDFFSIYNPAGFNPITGDVTNTGTSVGPGPLAGATSLMNLRTTSFSIQVTPITSMTNSQGNYQLGYFQQTGGFTIGTTTTHLIAQSSLMNNQYYQTGNSLTSYRQLRIPDVNDNTYKVFGTPSTNYETFMIIITGAPANTKVAKLDVFYVCEVLPLPSQSQYTVIDYPLPGIRTQDCIANIVYAFPALHSLTYDQAYCLADKIKRSEATYDAVMALVLSFSLKHKPPKPMSFLTGYSSTTNDMDLGSFDHF